MKNIIFIAAIAFGLYYFYPQSYLPIDIAEELYLDGNTVVYDGNNYESEWTSDKIRIKGHVRLIEQKSKKLTPIITTAIAISSGDFSDPEKVKIDSGRNGYAIYQLGNHEKLSGSLTIYHIIPDGAEVQSALDLVQSGDSISLLAKASTNGSLKSEKSHLTLQAYQPNKYVSHKLDKGGSSQVNQYLVFVTKVL